MRDLKRSELDFVSGGVPSSVSFNTNGKPGSSAGGYVLNRGIGGLGGFGYPRGAPGAFTNGTIGFNFGTGTPGAGGQVSVS